MGGFFMSGMPEIDYGDSLRETHAGRATQEFEMRTAINELKEKIGHLALLNQALWELLKTKLGLTEQDLETLAQKIDMRDGVADGQITAIAVTCPSCMRVNNSKHAKCLYCGQLFEKQVFG